MDTTGIPPGLHSVTPSLNLRGAAKALEFYKAAFGAVERFVMPGPGGTVMHGEFQIGDSVLMFSDEAPEWGALSPESAGGCPLSLNLYVPDCDAVIARAVEAGGELLKPASTHPWGERSGMVRDPFGYRWAVCTHLEELTAEEVGRRMQTWNSETGTW